MKIPTKEQVLEASEECPDAKRVLEKLFPDAFGKEWEDITMSLKFIPDTRQAFGFYWVGIYTEGATNHFAFINANGIHICDPHINDFKVEQNDDLYFRILEKK